MRCGYPPFCETNSAPPGPSSSICAFFVPLLPMPRRAWPRTARPPRPSGPRRRRRRRPGRAASAGRPSAGRCAPASRAGLAGVVVRKRAAVRAELALGLEPQRLGDERGLGGRGLDPLGQHPLARHADDGGAGGEALLAQELAEGLSEGRGVGEVGAGSVRELADAVDGRLPVARRRDLRDDAPCARRRPDRGVFRVASAS